jgi:hypothetical protein
MATAAAFFDLDKTIIATSSTLALGRTFYDSGLISRRVASRERTPGSPTTSAGSTRSGWRGYAMRWRGW